MAAGAYNLIKFYVVMFMNLPKIALKIGILRAEGNKKLRI